MAKAKQTKATIPYPTLPVGYHPLLVQAIQYHRRTVREYTDYVKGWDASDQTLARNVDRLVELSRELGILECTAKANHIEVR
jgi:hypothetical protein